MKGFSASPPFLQSLLFICYSSAATVALLLLLLWILNVSSHAFVFVFFIVRHCSFFMDIIFCTSVALIWISNSRGVYNFITKKANIPLKLVPFFNGVSFLFYRFLNSGVTNELKSLFFLKSKQSGLFIQNRAKLCCW